MVDEKIKELWNEIYFSLKDCISRRVLEKEYENVVMYCIALLGWKKSRGEIVSQYPVQTGHETKYADVVVLKDGIEQFVIELKRPNHVLSEDDEKQLFSYMRLLRHQVFFGLYVGEKIYLYYDDVDLHGFPEQVFSVDICENNPDGLKFVELFSKESFSVDALLNFCKKQKTLLEEQRQVQQEVDRIVSDTSGCIFKELLKKKYLNSGHSEKWVNNVLAQVSVTVSRTTMEDEDSIKSEPIVRKEQYLRDHAVPYVGKYRQRSNFSINGEGSFCKNRCALEVVKRYSREKNLSYKAIDSFFNGRIPNLVMRYDEVIRKQKNSYDNAKDKRWHFKYPLKSSDGIAFLVSTQVGEGCPIDFKEIVRLAASLGYDIKKI